MEERRKQNQQHADDKKKRMKEEKSKKKNKKNKGREPEESVLQSFVAPSQVKTTMPPPARADEGKAQLSQRSDKNKDLKGSEKKKEKEKEKGGSFAKDTIED